MSDFIAQYDDTKPTPSATEEQNKVEPKAEIKEEVTAPMDESDIIEAEKTADIKTEDKDPIDEAARAQGWVPQDEWDGDPTQWRDAQVFLERGEYFKTMGTQRKQIDKLNAMVEKMANIQAATREDERQKVLRELSDKKATAMEEGEFNKVVDIDNEMSKIRSEPAMSVPNVAAQTEEKYTSDKIAEYIDNNSWYRTNADMRQYADSIAVGFRTSNPNATIDDVLQYTDNEIKVRYPEVFGKQVPSASPVASTGRTTKPSPNGANKKKTLNDLPAGSRAMYAQIGQSFVDAGAVDSIDEYVAELEKIGEI
tara:strand:+ start:1288 stop:2217 length:930 start_codon:yes stop_codon:yes gene_type:complete